MANPRGLFDETLVPEGWFDKTLQAAGWFDGDFLDVASGGSSNTQIDPLVGNLALTGYAPTVAQTANQAVSPSFASLAFTGYAPTVAQSSGTAVNPANAALVLTGFTPTIGRTNNQAILPSAGSLTITGYAPSIAQSAGQNVSPSVGSLTITGYNPSIGQSANQAASPSVGNLTITGYAPSVVQAGVSALITPNTGYLTITGYAPDVAQSGAIALSFNGGFVMRKRKVYVKRGKQYLIFNNNEEADAYLAAESAIETAKKSSRGAAKRVIKALKVVKPEIAHEPKLEELSALIAKFDFKYDLPQLAKNNDIEALYHIQSMLYALQQDEEDIELLLLAL